MSDIFDHLQYVREWADARARGVTLEPFDDPTPTDVHERARAACDELTAYLRACPYADAPTVPGAVRAEDRATHIYG